MKTAPPKKAKAKRAETRSKVAHPKVTISLTDRVEGMLDSLGDLLGYDNKSALICQLIRDTYEVRHGKLVLNVSPPSGKADSATTSPTGSALGGSQDSLSTPKEDLRLALLEALAKAIGPEALDRLLEPRQQELKSSPQDPSAREPYGPGAERASAKARGRLGTDVEDGATSGPPDFPMASSTGGGNESHSPRKPSLGAAESRSVDAGDGAGQGTQSGEAGARMHHAP